MTRHAHHGNDHGKPKITTNLLQYEHMAIVMKHALSWIAPAYERVRRTSSFSLERFKLQKVHNVHNSPIDTSRSVCACAQPALNRSTVKLIKTGSFMTYPTIHTCISFC